MSLRTILIACAFLAVACGATDPALSPGTAASPSPTAAGLPRPTPQKITRTSPAAQVAWLWTYTPDNSRRSLVSVDPTSRVVTRIAQAPTGFTAWRSADGSAILTVDPGGLTSYSAKDGTPQRTFPRAPGGIAAEAFSPDGRWLAILLAGPTPQAQLIDIRSGTSTTAPITHDPNARLPGLSGQTASAFWATLAFGRDSGRLYVVSDWAGPMRLTAFDVAEGSLRLAGTALDGDGGHHFPTCDGPAVATKVVSERDMVIFCHYDGAVWFIDLATLTIPSVVRTDQKNPFWLSPIFTPDGRLLYAHQWPAFGETMQVVDLAARKLPGPVRTPTKVGDPGPFNWRFPVAYAGGVASTMPVSPDGTKIYTATSEGVIACGCRT